MKYIITLNWTHIQDAFFKLEALFCFSRNSKGRNKNFMRKDLFPLNWITYSNCILP